MKLFGSSGTRGVVGDSLTPEFVLRIAKAAGSVWETDRAIVARDARTTGEMFSNAATSGLESVGVDVDRLGPTPTPSAVRYAGETARPAIVITASHNPPEYNGVKLVGADGVELGVDDLEEIESHVLEERFATAAWDAVGDSRRVESANCEYVADLLDAVDRESIAAADLTVALDPGHGPGALTSPEFFRKLGCEVVTVNANADGHFPGRPSEPVEPNLGDLKSLVRAADADVGIAHDGDADRAVFVDERGEFVAGEASLAALAAAALDTGDTTVAAVNVSQRLVDVCEDAGATLELTPIGATNIITRIRELHAAGERVPIAGEGNGGVFFPPYRLARDGAYGAARFLELVAERPASEIVSPYDDYHFVQANLEYGEDTKRDRMIAAATAWAKGQDGTLDTTDGYRVDYGDAWVLMRESGTEPLVRAYAEARDRDRAESLLGEAVDVLEDA